MSFPQAFSERKHVWCRILKYNRSKSYEATRKIACFSNKRICFLTFNPFSVKETSNPSSKKKPFYFIKKMFQDLCVLFTFGKLTFIIPSVQFSNCFHFESVSHSTLPEAFSKIPFTGVLLEFSHSSPKLLSTTFQQIEFLRQRKVDFDGSLLTCNKKPLAGENSNEVPK